MKLLTAMAGAMVALALGLSVPAWSENAAAPATSSISPQSSRPATSGGEGQGRQDIEAMQLKLRQDIEAARTQGRDVSDAQYFADTGNAELSHGNQDDAMRYFQAAQNALAESSTASSENPPVRAPSAAEAANARAQEQQQGAPAVSPGGQPPPETSSQGVLTLQQRVRRDIARLDAQLADAQSLEAQGRAALEAGDEAAAARCFRAAQRSLGAAAMTQPEARLSAQRLAQQVARYMEEARARGANISDAQWFDNLGREQLSGGNTAQAEKYFRAAELALGIPVEVGYAEVWATAVPIQGAQPGAAAQQPGQPAGVAPGEAAAQRRRLARQIGAAKAQGRDVSDVEYFYNAGEKELKGGDEAAAMRDFHIAHAFLAAATPANAPGAQDQNNPPQTNQ